MPPILERVEFLVGFEKGVLRYVFCGVEVPGFTVGEGVDCAFVFIDQEPERGIIAIQSALDEFGIAVSHIHRSRSCAALGGNDTSVITFYYIMMRVAGKRSDADVIFLE